MKYCQNQNCCGEIDEAIQNYIRTQNKYRNGAYDTFCSYECYEAHQAQEDLFFSDGSTETMAIVSHRLAFGPLEQDKSLADHQGQSSSEGKYATGIAKR